MKTTSHSRPTASRVKGQEAFSSGQKDLFQRLEPLTAPESGAYLDLSPALLGAMSNVHKATIEAQRIIRACNGAFTNLVIH